MEQPLVLSRYRPLEDLGEGAFGRVVLAWDTRMQRRVAIKRLPLPLDERGVPHRPLGLNEARTAAMLSHPHIVTVFDFDTDSDEAFLVMEYVDGASLGDLLDAADGLLTPDEATAVLSDIASALAFAHENGVLHLDIKPDNVLIGRDGRAKVADFGMAELSTIAGHGPAWGGTLGYMPLEQLAGDVVTQKTDEWALAALAFEALTGDNPFDAATPEGAIQRIEVLDVPLPSDYDPSLGEAVDDALLTALSRHPSERFDTVTEFAEVLLPALGDASQGRASLAGLVDSILDEEAPRDEEPERLGLWDRLRGRAGSTLIRVTAAAEAAWLAWTGLTPFSLEPAALGGAVALIALAAVLAPGLGIGLGLAALVAGLAAHGMWAAPVVLVIGGAWWWLVARRNPGAAVLPLSAPVLALARVPFLQPLLAGFTMSPAKAAITAVLGGTLTMLASAISASGPPYLAVWPGYALDIYRADLATANVRQLLTSLAALIALLSWPAAAALMSLACARASRLAAFFGLVGAGALLAGGYVLAEQTAVRFGLPVGYESPDLGVALGASLILMGLVIVLGAPTRPEEEGTFAVRSHQQEDDDYR